MKAHVILIGEDRYIDIGSVAKTLDLAKTTVRAGCRDGLLVCRQVGGSWYIRQDSLKGFLKQIQGKRVHKSVSVGAERRQERAEIDKKLKNSKRLFRVGGEISIHRGK